MQDILRAHRISLPKKTLTRLFLLSISAVYFLGILLTPVYAQEAYSSQPTPQKLSEGIRKPEHLTFLLPEALVSTVSSFLRYSTSFIFGAGSVEAESDIPTKKTTPFIDRISLTLYCAFSKSDSDPRCDYDSATQELFSVPSATSQTANQTVTQAAGTAISGVETATSTAVSTTPPVSTVTPAPVYITRYITQIVEGLPGRDGKDGKDGRDGKDGLASVNGIQMVPGYGSYINPMVNSSNIVGISTIGYLKDATIDTSILNGGSALNLSLSAPTLTNAVFNASSLFNGPATFLGNVGINSLSATSSTFGSALITDLTVSSSTITNLTGTNFWSNLATIVTGIFTNLTATNATTTNATSTNLFTTNATIVNASVTNATSTNLTATNATTTNATSTNFFSSLLSATTGLFTTLSSTGTSTFATSDGNVGIGTTNPTNKLSVVSDVIGSTTPKSAIASFDNLQLTSLEGGTFLGRSRISESSLALANYGVNWIARETSRNWTAIAMSSDGRIQTATAYNGQLYTSTDYGVTWTPRDSNRNWYGIAMSSDGRIQTATPFGGQIYTSTDYGITWTARDSNRNWIGVAMSSDGRIQTATALGDQLYTSTDYGVTWTARDSVRDWDGVAMSSDGRIQTAITYGAQIYTSTDYGITWTARDSSRNWYSVAMSSDGRIQTAAAIGGDQLYTSTDYGVTWTARDSNRDWIAVAMSSDGRIQTAVVTNGQLYTSTDYGVSWTARESSRGWRNISMSSDGRIQTAAVNGGQLYTSTADVQTQGNLKVAGNIDNTSSSVNLALIGSVGVGFNPSAVKVVGRYAYVVNNGSNIFMVIDVSNPAFPAVISSAAIGQGPVALDVSGRYAYVLNYGSRTMQVVDISNPSSVSVVGSVAVGTQSNSAGDVQSNSIAVVGNYAYIVNTGSNSFQVIDIASPTAPRVVSTYTSGLSAPTSVALAGSYAYVTNRLAGLQLINISNPLSPTAAGSVTAGSYPETVAVSGRYAYVTNSIDNTLSVIDVSNPASPPIIATLAIGSTPKSVSINGRYAYVSIMGSSGQGKIQVIDIASSTAPSVVGTSLTISGPTSIYISGRYGYVTSFDSDTLKILDVGGLETSGATIASLEAGSAQIRNDLVVQGNTFMSALNAVSAYVENLSAKVLSAASLVLGSASSMVSNAILSINTNTTGTELTTKNSASSFTVSGYATTTGVAINSAAQGGGITLLLASTTSIGNGTMTAGPSLSSGTAQYGSHSIQRPDGKFLIINGGATSTTNLYDPVANTFVAGPSLANGNADDGSHSIQRPDGKFLVINGNQTAVTNIYDPVANTMTAGPSLASGLAWVGSHSIQRPDGKFLIINGSNSAVTNLYDPVANTMTAGPSFATETAGYGSHSIQRPDGKFLIINGGLATTTNLYDPVANTMTAGPSLASGTADDGSHSIQRPDGKFLIINGGGTATTNLYDPVANTFAVGPSLSSGTASNGSHSIQRPDGKFLIINGGLATTTNLYDPVANTFTLGPSLSSGTADDGSHSIQRPDGKFLIINGNNTSVTNIYDPSYVTSGTWESEDMNLADLNPSSVLNYSTNGEGSILVAVKTATTQGGLSSATYATTTSGAKINPVPGAQWAKVRVTFRRSVPTNRQPMVNANETNTWLGGSDIKYQRSFANPTLYSFSILNQKGYHITNTDFGTNAASTTLTSNATSGPIISNLLPGDNGLTLPYTLDIPDNASAGDDKGAISSGPSLSSGTISASAHSLQRPDGKFLIINGGATATTTLYDPVTNTFTAGPSLATGTASTGSHSIQRPDGKFLIINGNNGSVTNIYDPVANTFIAGPSLATGTAYIGSHSLQRPDGKFLIINGNGAATNLYDPVANTFVAGPTLATGTADGGSHSLQRPDGKFLIINGNGVATNLYDPGWITRGYYESEFVNDATLDTNSVLTWKGNADAYKAGVVSVRVRTATSSAALQTALWRTLPVSGSKINPASAETWIQVRFEMNRVIPGSVGVLRNSVPTDGGIIVYNRLPLNPSAGYANQAGVFIKPTVYSYAIQKQEGQDLATFQVNGNNVFRFSATGDAYTAPGGSWNAGGADVAEYFPTEDMLLEPGDVVSVSQDEKGLVSMTTTDYDETLLGIVTTAPGLRLGSDDIGANQHKQPIALAGRVPVKISLENGPVKKGDYLTSSRNRPGYAMKSLDAGRVVGIALEDYTLDDDAEHGGAGKVLVFVNPQFSMGPSFMEKVTGNFSRIAIMIRKGVSEFGITIAEDGNVGFGVINPLSKIHSASNVRLGVASTTSGTLLFHNEANGFVTGIRSATSTLASDFTFTLPDTIGDPRQALMGDGAGSLYWGRVAYIGKNGTTTPGYAVRWLPDGEVASGVLMDDGEVAGVHATSSAAFTVAQATETQPAFSVLSAIKHTFFSVDGSGMVSVGTSTASSRFAIFDETTSNDADLFQVVSNVGQVNDSKFRVTAGGDLFVKSSISVGLGASIAESYPALEAVDAGTVVAFGASTSTWETSIGTTTESFDIMGIVKATSSIEAIGIVTANPGVALATKTRQGVSVAFLGRVPVKVTTENGIVRAGDYLTVSTSTPGYAMKLTGEGRAIGRAVSDYREGRDKVMVLIDKGDHMLDLSGNFATTTKMLTTGNVDLNANAVAIINIKSLTSANGSWSIDENGRIVAQVLCLGNVCINKDQLTNMLNSTGQGSASGNQSSGDSGETGTAVPEGEATGIATSTDSSTSEPSQVSAASEEGEADDPEPETPPVTVASEPETIQ